MSKLAAAAALMMCFPAASQVASRDSLATAIVRAAAAPFRTLHVLGGASRAGSSLSWAAWDVASPATGSAVQLALLDRGRGAAKLVWIVQRNAGYDPTIELVEQWRHDGNPVLLFRYQLGAAAQELELYSLNRQNQPVLLDQQLADLYTTELKLLNGNNILAVVAHSRSAGGEPTQSCYRFDATNSKLERFACT